MKQLLLFCAFILLGNFHLSAQWYAQPLPSGIGMLLSVDFSDSLCGISGGWILTSRPEARAVYTYDGGTSWYLSTLPDSAHALVVVQMIDSKIGYSAAAYHVPGGSLSLRKKDTKNYPWFQKRKMQHLGELNAPEHRAFFLKTDNGGASWKPVGKLSDSLWYSHGMKFWDERTGVVSFSTETYDVIKRTTDGGDTWNPVVHPAGLNIIEDFNLVSDSVGFAIGSNYSSVGSIIMKTTDRGATWKTVFPAMNGFSSGLTFSDENTGYAAALVPITLDSSQIHVYKTEDGGANWRLMPSLLPEMLEVKMQFLQNSRTGFLIGAQFIQDTLSNNVETNYSRCFVTHDGAETWREVEIPAVEGDILQGMKIINNKQAYITGGNVYSRALVMYTPEAIYSGTENANPVLATSISLAYNYPNPFNPSTTIQYKLAEKLPVAMLIYDAAGNQIVSVDLGEQGAGIHQYQFDGSAHSSGVYFCRLIAGRYTSVLKMLLLK